MPLLKSHAFFWLLNAGIPFVHAQGNLLSLLQSQPDLTTLVKLVGLVPGLAETLGSSSNITILAPTDTAFANVPRDVPEGQAIEAGLTGREVPRFDTKTAVSALLANHVFKGVYPSNAVGNVPTFAQTLLNTTYQTERQPFTGFTGGAYNGLVKNGTSVVILSGEQTVSNVVQADIKLGDGITIHKIDLPLSFGTPLLLSLERGVLTDMNAALSAANLGISIGLTSSDGEPDFTDFTILVPNNEAFQLIGSVFQSADVKELKDVLSYHIIPKKVIFSPSIGNVTVKTLGGADLTFTVTPDGTIWANDAKIIFPNAILYSGVAHVIDTVIKPEAFDRASIKPSAPAAQRLAFVNATSVSKLPFTSVSFAGDTELYTTPQILRTVAAIAVPKVPATVTGSMATQPSAQSNASIQSAPLQTSAATVVYSFELWPVLVGFLVHIVLRADLYAF